MLRLRPDASKATKNTIWNAYAYPTNRRHCLGTSYLCGLGCLFGISIFPSDRTDVLERDLIKFGSAPHQS